MTYFLAHQVFTKFPGIDDISKFHNPLNLSPFSIGLGDILELDKYLEKQYPTIKPTYSSTRNQTKMSNLCEHCKALLGRNYVVDDPHEIMGIMLHEPEKFDSKIICKIKPSAIGLTRSSIKEILLSNLE